MLYIMRYGKTDWNVQHKLQGRIDIPNNEKYKGKWNFWQHTDCGKVTGIKGNVDCNIFNGSFEDLMNLTIPEQEDNYTDPEDSL